MSRYSKYSYLLLTYMVGMLFFLLFRVANAIAYSLGVAPTENPGLYPHAFVNGLRFDTLISCYILVLPLLLITIGEVAHISRRWYYAIAHHFAVACYIVCFFACAANIPYFSYFLRPLNASVLEWDDSFGTVASMIFSEPTYVFYLLLFIAISVGYWLLMRWIYRRTVIRHLDQHAPLAAAIVLLVVMGFGLFVGMRGRLNKKSPLRIGSAYFCTDTYLNQLGLNPVFTFMKSIEDAGKSKNKPVALTDMATADAVWEARFSEPYASDATNTPLLLPEGTNVVLVLMESMSADKTTLSDRFPSLTPNLDSLMALSHTFSNAWSAGIHTHNGIYSTLFSHPALMQRHMLKQTLIPQMCGLPQALSSAGYSTAYFMTHDPNFDNLLGFLYGNAYSTIVSEPDYPSSEVVGTWGIPDHKLFDHVIDYCNSQPTDRPFFVTVMTCSDHGPYIMPEGIDFMPQNPEATKRIVEYADWSIGRFMRQAAQQEWYHNTLFVFVADHGGVFPTNYDLVLSYNHIPILLHYPGAIIPTLDERPAMQVDVAPTVCGMLGIPYSAGLCGLDLQRYNRRYAFFSADNKMGVVSDSLLYTWRADDGVEGLYRFRENSTDNLLPLMPDTAATMRRYAFGITQHSQAMLLNGSTRCQ